MEKYDLENVKDAVYELEGLLELACLREDKKDALLPLMKNKLEIINAYFGALDTRDDGLIAEGTESTYVSEDDDASEYEEAVSEELPSEPAPSPSLRKVEPNAEVRDVNAAKPAFCVNDRFRFRRELFDNSDKEFDAAMNLVATMENYEEAEDYFLGDLGWDMETPEVADFMAIIHNYFER